ncbi:uncharacterized protein DS421_18g633090 [Arachis hypogaea]|nr:uncharacterized protein DS421_18g633090 [Arachis hypogaea]
MRWPETGAYLEKFAGSIGLMVDEVHLRRFDGLLENGGVHRCVIASITVKAPVCEVWNVLTAYEKLSEIIPNLAISKILSRYNNKIRILQVIFEDLPSNLSAIRDYVENRNGLKTSEASGKNTNSRQQIASSGFEKEEDNVQSSCQQRPKVPGLQRDIEILKSELVKFIAAHGQEGLMPMRKHLRLHGRVAIEKAITRMGGFRKIATIMNLSLAYKQRKPKGYWDKLENLQDEAGPTRAPPDPNGQVQGGQSPTRTRVPDSYATAVRRKHQGSLPQGSVAKFSDISHAFLAQFTTRIAKAKHPINLLGVTQRSGEPTRKYLDRFNDECLEIDGLTDSVASLCLTNGLLNEDFRKHLTTKPVWTMQEIQCVAREYINDEEVSQVVAANKRQPSYSQNRHHESGERQKKHARDGGSSKIPRPFPRVGKFTNYTPLTAPIMEVYQQIAEKGILSKLRPLKERTGGSMSLYCDYHKGYGHKTQDCFDLKYALEQAIRDGKLAEFSYLIREPRRRNRDHEGKDKTRAAKRR